MLNSIKNTGGFWIGKYEVGIEGTQLPRTASGDATQTPVIQEGAYPYNYVTCSQAQERASTLSAGNYTSSLMFGIQWDLVCKFIETKATNPGTSASDIKVAINTNSTDWGNDYDADFEIKRGQYTTNPSTANSWKNFDVATDGTGTFAGLGKALILALISFIKSRLSSNCEEGLFCVLEAPQIERIILVSNSSHSFSG